MLSKDHICPYGTKSKHLLESKGFKVEDHHLKSREEIDAFKEKHGVKTTPQTFIDGKRIGGYDELVNYFDVFTLKQVGITYQPIIAIFATTFLLAIATTFAISDTFNLIKIIELFIAFSMCVLGIMKLRDLYSFTNQFLGYDLLAMKWFPYAYIYPFVETIAGILMVSGAFIWLAAPAAFLIGTIGGISVFKAVYIDKRDLKCACVGGNSSVPLGFISLTENIMMVAMAIWMVVK
jgi:glutaredoxin